MNSCNLVSCLFCLLIGCVLVAGEPATGSQFSDAAKNQIERWASRLRTSMPNGWTVSIQGDDIIVQRRQPIKFECIRFEGMSCIPSSWDIREGMYRITLRFGPRISQDRYDQLVSENKIVDRERSRLRDAVNVRFINGDFYPDTPEDERQMQSFKEALKKLPRHSLPDLYTTDNSIYLTITCDSIFPACLHDKTEAAECFAVEERVLGFFGKYNPLGFNFRSRTAQ